MIIIADTAQKLLSCVGALALRDRQNVTIMRADGDVFATSTAYTLVVQHGNVNIASVILTQSGDKLNLTGELNTHTSEAVTAFSDRGYVTSIDCRVMLFDATNIAAPVMVAGQDVIPMRFNSYGSDSYAVPSTLQIGSTTIGNGVSTVAVTFTTAFAQAPRIVVALVSTPANADNIGCLSVSSLTASGFTANLSATTAVTGYKLFWEARL